MFFLAQDHGKRPISAILPARVANQHAKVLGKPSRTKTCEESKQGQGETQTRQAMTIIVQGLSPITMVKGQVTHKVQLQHMTS